MCDIFLCNGFTANFGFNSADNQVNVTEDDNYFNVYDNKTNQEYISFRKYSKTENMLFAKVCAIANLLNEIEGLKS